jgi:hypothetical protein
MFDVIGKLREAIFGDVLRRKTHLVKKLWHLRVLIVSEEPPELHL